MGDVVGRLFHEFVPKIVTDESVDSGERARCRPQHVHMPPYPADAQRQGIQGQTYVEYSVWPDGRSRNPRIIFAVPKDMFDSAVRDTLLHTNHPGVSWK